MKLSFGAADFHGRWWLKLRTSDSHWLSRSNPSSSLSRFRCHSAHAHMHSPTRAMSVWRHDKTAIVVLIDLVNFLNHYKILLQSFCSFPRRKTYIRQRSTMGNEESKPQTLYRRISKALPPVAPQYGNNENSDWVDKGAKAFASDGDRDQFICKPFITFPFFSIFQRHAVDTYIYTFALSSKESTQRTNAKKLQTA